MLYTLRISATWIQIKDGPNNFFYRVAYTVNCVSKKIYLEIALLLVADILLLLVPIANPPEKKITHKKITLLSTTTEYPIQIQPETDTRNQWETMRMRVTAYCPCRRCCGRFSDGKTANNHKIKKGDTFVAADKKMGFLSEIIVPGYNHDKPVKVMDRGRAIKGNRLDVFFDSHNKAKKWGVKYLDVKLKTSQNL